MNFSSMTAEEEFRMNGTLSGQRVSELLDASAQLESIKDIDACIEEARAQYPAEDFLASFKDRLGQLVNNLRGDNKEKGKALMASIEDIEMTTFYAADYGRKELNKALAAIKGETKPQPN